MHHNVEIWMRVFILKNILNSYIVLIIQNNFFNNDNLPVIKKNKNTIINVYPK